jgi:hypothetical protein
MMPASLRLRAPVCRGCPPDPLLGPHYTQTQAAQALISAPKTVAWQHALRPFQYGGGPQDASPLTSDSSPIGDQQWHGTVRSPRSTEG